MGVITWRSPRVHLTSYAYIYLNIYVSVGCVGLQQQEPIFSLVLCEGDSKVILIKALPISFSIMFVPYNKMIRLVFVTIFLDIFRLTLVYTSLHKNKMKLINVDR